MNKELKEGKHDAAIKVIEALTESNDSVFRSGSTLREFYIDALNIAIHALKEDSKI